MEDGDGSSNEATAADAVVPRGRGRARPERVFGDPLPPRERAMWSLLDTKQRGVAMQRAFALVRWADGKGGITAKRAAADAGVTPVRFYQMAARWRDDRSLASLGVAAAPERVRRSQFDPAVNEVLQAAVVAVVGADDEASVRSLALALAEEARRRGIRDDDLPKHNTLRTVVERELRRRREERQVGNALLLDHAACGILRPDGVPWTMFAVVDAASQLIIGAAVRETDLAASGYAAAARDALRRIEDRSFDGLPWADRLASIQVVPGAEGPDALRTIAQEASSCGVGLNFTSDRKAGRYLESKIGRFVGTVPIWSARKGVDRLSTSAEERAPRLDRQKADARLALAVDDRDAGRIAEMRGVGASPPPAPLLHMLAVLAR